MIPPSGTIAFWVVALVVFLIVEAVTAGLVSIWFVFGSLVALICAALGAAVWLQIFWFVIVSVATLVLTRPLVKRYVDSRSVATNAVDFSQTLSPPHSRPVSWAYSHSGSRWNRWASASAVGRSATISCSSIS